MITNILRILLARSLKPLVFTNDVEDNFRFEGEELGIYVHIPFCKTLCPFCPYNKVKYNEELAARYKAALIKEINMTKKNYSDKIINSVYFGGGTPALMLHDLRDIMGALRENFNIKGDIGIELHPSDINENCLKELKNAGFNMVSIGIQSFQEKCLQSLGREYINGENKVKLVKEYGFEVIDVDLIFGIAGQTEEDLRDDFLKAFQCGATQVSTYPFIDFSYAHNKNKPLNTKEKKKLLECLEEVSSEVNCSRTSVWTFGRREIPKYSSITRDLYMGFGPSAATLTKDVFQINTSSVEEYIKHINSNKKAGALVMKFTKRTRALYWLFWNAYTLKLNREEFHKLFKEELDEVFNMELKLASLLGLIKKTSYGYELTRTGAYIYHLLEQHYTHQYIDKTWRITKETSWPEEIKLY